MIMRLFVVASILSLLVACAAGPDKTGPTLESLQSKTIHIDTGRQSQASIDVDRAIKVYESLAGNKDSGALNAKAMRSLADLEMQRIAKAYDDAEGNLDDVSYAKAIHWYQTLLVTYPKHPDREDVLYQLGRAFEHSGEIDKALRMLKILSQKYPKSSRADEANFRRGEIMFLDQNYQDAELAYSKVIAMGTASKFYEQAVFKFAWSVYKQERCVDSVGLFLSILDSKLNQNLAPSQLVDLSFLSVSDVELVEEAIRASNLCFSQQTSPLYITEYFSGKEPRVFEFIIYTRLGEYFLKQDRPYDAAEVFSGFYDRAPWHPYGVILQDRAIDIYNTRGKKDLVVPGKKTFVHRYEDMTKYWRNSSHNNYYEYLVRTDAASVLLIKDSLKGHILELAKYHHAKAQRTSLVVDFQEAVTWYRRYLRYYPQGEEVSAINFMLAEALYEDKLFVEAIAEYERVAYTYGKHDKAAEAAYAGLLAYDEQEKILKSEVRADWHKKALVAALRFAKSFPGDARSIAVLVKTAEDFYASEHYDDALVTAQLMVDRYPNASSKMKRSALLVLAHTHFEIENYNISELYYGELLLILGKGDPLYKEAKARLVASIYKQAENLRAEGSLKGALDEFKRLLAAVPGTEIRPVVEYDVAAIYVMLDDWESALSLLEPFAKKYPYHNLASAAAEKVAVGYLKLEKHAEAAKALVGLSKLQQSPDMLRETLWQAAELYEEAGELDNAVDTYLQYAHQFPRPLEPVLEAQYRTGMIYKKQQRSFNYRIQLQKIYDADQKGGAERTDRTRFLAAQSAFELAEPLYLRYERIKLVEPIRKNMKLKDQYMKQALSAYGKAAELDVAEFTTAATFRIGAMYSDFSIKLMDSDRPGNLNEEELEQYELMLEEQAFPFEEKAIGLHEANIGRMAAGIYDKWVRKSLSALAEFMPARYRKLEHRDAVFTTLE